MELTQMLVFEQIAEKDKHGEITENAYPEGPDECLFYAYSRTPCDVTSRWKTWTDNDIICRPYRFLSKTMTSIVLLLRWISFLGIL